MNESLNPARRRIVCFGGALVASFCWKAGPILLIIAGGVIGFLIY